MDVAKAKSLGKSFRKLRKQRGLSQVELAARLDRPQSFISKVESGERQVRLVEIYDFSDALETPVIELVKLVEVALVDDDLLDRTNVAR